MHAPPSARVLALVVDEAQSLPHELLEEVRLLTNTEAANGRSLAVVLVGQPELAARLNEPRLRQLKQRVALRCELTPLEPARRPPPTSPARVRPPAATPTQLFTRDAVIAIHEHSRGIPRTISVICDNALVNGFAARPETGRRERSSPRSAATCRAAAPTPAPSRPRAAADRRSRDRQRRGRAGARTPMFSGVAPAAAVLVFLRLLTDDATDVKRSRRAAKATVDAPGVALDDAGPARPTGSSCRSTRRRRAGRAAPGAADARRRVTAADRSPSAGDAARPSPAAVGRAAVADVPQRAARSAPRADRTSWSSARRRRRARRAVPAARRRAASRAAGERGVRSVMIDERRRRRKARR